jgi:hypothetical protein
MALDSASFQLHQAHEESHLRDQLESLATEQFISHRVPVELSSAPEREEREGEGAGCEEVMVTAEDRISGYQGIPEGEQIPGSMSPIRGIPPNAEQLVVFHTDKTY